MENLEVVSGEILEKVTPVSKLGISFEQLWGEANAIQSECEDFSVNAVGQSAFSKIRFDADAGCLNYIPSDYIGTPLESRSSPMSQFAFRQLCNKLGVPANYVEKCLKSGQTELAEDNVNTWLEEMNRNLFIREYKNRIRGVLSDRYMVLDTPQIMDVLNDVVDSGEYSTKGYFLSPERFHARIVQNNMLQIPGLKEDLFAGIQIDSSDVGRSTLLVRFFLYKQVCTNGMCISKGNGVLFQQRHVGINIDSFRDTFAESMKCIPDLIGMISYAIKTQSQNDYSFLLRDEGAIENFIQNVRSKTRLSNDGVEDVISLMKTNYSYTHWGFVNALTEHAQKYTLERRIELEEMAGEYLLAS